MRNKSVFNNDFLNTLIEPIDINDAFSFEENFLDDILFNKDLDQDSECFKHDRTEFNEITKNYFPTIVNNHYQL